MADTDNSKTSLSGNVLQMKFMKRSALRIEKEKSLEERKQIIDDEHWVLDIPAVEHKQKKYIVEPSYTSCEDLVYGRMSFQGFNLEVEKLMKANNEKLNLEEAERKENEIGVNDVEMADRFNTLVGTMSKKFAKKRDRSTMDPQEESTPVPSNTGSNRQKKKRFMKPADD